MYHQMTNPWADRVANNTSAKTAEAVFGQTVDVSVFPSFQQTAFAATEAGRENTSELNR